MSKSDTDKIIAVEPKVLDFLKYFQDNYGVEEAFKFFNDITYLKLKGGHFQNWCLAFKLGQSQQTEA